ALFLLSLTVLLTALLAAGMLTRERRHIGFEGLAILGCYAAGIVALLSM
ncbi:MAG: sodium:calcium antiporter, partial [Acidimicrobiales bacterium]|nr:sodium:calcium antiporter [Acidimicrobiales bacterium]